MITLFNSLHLDLTVTAIISFIYILACVAIYQMHNTKDGILFFLYITASAFIIFLFINFTMISAGIVFLYIMRLVYRNLRMDI